MANRIQLRRDTAANWTRVNPVLEDGEPGLEIDTNQVKYGDGNTAWANLSYAGGSGSVSFDYSTVQEGTAGPGNVTSITGGDATGVGLTSEQWAQLMWVPNTANTTVADIGDGPATYNWAYVDSDGFRVESNVADVRNTWVFYANSLLTTPGNVQIGNVATYGNISYVNTISANNYVYANGVSILSGITGGSANIGDITFNGIKMIGANIGGGSAEIELVPDYTGDFYANGQYVRIYPTRAVPDSPHIHIDSGSGGDLIIGNDQRGVDINHDANVYIRTDQYAGAWNWRFGTDGNLVMPSGSLKIDSGYETAVAGFVADASVAAGTTQLYASGNIASQILQNRSGFGDPIQLSVYEDNDNPAKTWTFTANGNLALPNGKGIIGAIETTDSVDLYGDINTQYVQLNYNNQNFVYVDTSGAHMQAGPTAPGEYEIWLSVDGSTTFPDHKPVSITGNLTVGNLIVNGNTTTINTTSYSVSDNIIQMATDNPADTLDLGFVAHRTVNSTLQHTGLVRDASAGMWKLFSNVTTQPGNTVDFTGVVYDDLQLDKLFADTVHLTGTAPASAVGAAGDLAGDIHVDSNYLYYCTTDYVPLSYSVGWAGSASNDVFIVKGDYPTPQVGWIVSYSTYTFTADTVTDAGSNWQITYTGTPFGSPSGGTATLTNPTQPVIWKSAPLSAFQTAANSIAGNLTTGNISATQYNFANGVNILSTVSGGGGSYANADAAAYLAANSAIYLGNPVARYPLQANVAQAFVGNTTTIAAGGGASLGITYLLNNLYFGSNGTTYYRNTQTGAAQLSISGAGGFSFAGTTGAVTANAVGGLGAWASLTSSGFATQNSLGITSAGTLTVNGAGGIVSGQATMPLFNSVATTINFGGAATTINMGASTVAVSVGSGTGTVNANHTGTANFTNLYTANAVIAGGYATGLANITVATGGNIAGVGNIVGSSANTTITAGAYTSSFLSNGMVAIGGNLTVSGNNNNVVTKASFIGATGTAVTLDNISANWNGGPAQFQIATVSGSILAHWNIQTSFNGTFTVSSNNGTLTTSPTNTGGTAATAGDAITVMLTDITNGRFYRITGHIGPSYLNSPVIIERVV